MRVLLYALIFFHVLQVTVAFLTGIDTSDPVSKASFTCLKKAGYSFYIPRIYRNKNNGEVDEPGITNIAIARSANFTDIDAYFFPCAYSSCRTVATQLTDTYNSLKAKNATIGTLWLDVEGAASWSKSKATNQQFILDWTNNATKLGFQIGIYSAVSQWEPIVGLSWAYVSQYPLYWARATNVQDMTHKWENFGGWTAATVHQWSIQKHECGVSIDKDIK